MEYIFTNLSLIYVYWACLLAVWSIINGGMLFKIIVSTYSAQSYTKQATLMILLMILVSAIVLLVSVFVIPQITVLFVEVGLMLALWYTVFSATISHLSVVEHLNAVSV